MCGAHTCPTIVPTVPPPPPQLPPPASTPAPAVAGIDKAPQKVTRSMSQKKFNKKTSVKPFVKFVNYNHIMPTRYNLDVHDKIKAQLGDDTLTNEEKKKAALKSIKATLDERCVLGWPG